MKEHEMGRTLNTYEMRNGFTVSFGKLEGRSLTTSTPVTEDNIVADIKEIVSEAVDWNLLVQDIIDCPSVMYTAITFMVPQRR
jgi:hypothetical protein